VGNRTRVPEWGGIHTNYNPSDIYTMLLGAVSQPYDLIADFKPPDRAAGGPAFSCSECRRELQSYEWVRDYADASGRALELRCACGRRYRWTRDASTIEVLFNQWYREHLNGYCEVTRAPNGLFVYGLRSRDSQQARWLGRANSLQLAQRAADALLAPHECHCVGWRGYS